MAVDVLIRPFLKELDFEKALAELLPQHGWEPQVMMNRLNGESSFDWVGEFVTNFEDKLGRRNNTIPVIGYEWVRYLSLDPR